MTYFFRLFIFLSFFALSSADEAGGTQKVQPVVTEPEMTEEDAIQLLIQAQEQSVQKLKLLLQYLHEFRAQEALSLKNPENMDNLYKLSDCAYRIKKLISECYVEPYFRPQFLEDIKKLSSVAEKKDPPPLVPEEPHS